MTAPQEAPPGAGAPEAPTPARPPLPPQTERRALLAAGLMLGAAALAQALVPTKKLSDLRGPFDLKLIVPTRFGDWQVDPYATGGVVNPQAEAMLKRIYSQILERTYVNAQGRRVMLSIAYGSDQSDVSMQMHYPEVCYPAQGFQVRSNRRDQLMAVGAPIEVRRLETEMARYRKEPVTYWTLVGDQQSLGGWDKRLAELRHGLRGEIVDGILVRVSSIGADSADAFALHDRFVQAMLAGMAPAERPRLVGRP